MKKILVILLLILFCIKSTTLLTASEAATLSTIDLLPKILILIEPISTDFTFTSVGMKTTLFNEEKGICGKVECSINWERYYNTGNMKFLAYEKPYEFLFRWTEEKEVEDFSRYDFNVRIFGADIGGPIPTELFKMGILFMNVQASVAQENRIHYRVSTRLNVEPFQYNGSTYNINTVVKTEKANNLILIFMELYEIPGPY